VPSCTDLLRKARDPSRLPCTALLTDNGVTVAFAPLTGLSIRLFRTLAVPCRVHRPLMKGLCRFRDILIVDQCVDELRHVHVQDARHDRRVARSREVVDFQRQHHDDALRYEFTPSFLRNERIEPLCHVLIGTHVQGLEALHNFLRVG